MRNRMMGAMLAVVAVAMLALALPSASGDTSSDVREAEIYAGSAFAYSPMGDWTDAEASGTALDSGMKWTDGTLSGTIDVPGTYRAVLQSADDSLTVVIEVLPIATINGHAGTALKGDSVVASGSEEGTIVHPLTVGGPDGTDVTMECDRSLFAFDAEKGFVLAREVTDSDAGDYTLTVRAHHESGPLYVETSLTVNVKVLSKAEATGLDAQDLASFGTRSGSVTYVVTTDGIEPVSNPSYAAPSEPAVSSMRLYADGRDVRITSSVTDAQKLTYNWGDGIRSESEVGSVLNGAQHTYAHGGTYSVVITAEGPYSSAFAVAVFDTPGDAQKGFIEEHGWIFIVFAVLAVLFAVAFWFTRDPRMIIATAASAVLAIVCLILKVGA